MADDLKDRPDWRRMGWVLRSSIHSGTWLAHPTECTHLDVEAGPQRISKDYLLEFAARNAMFAVCEHRWVRVDGDCQELWFREG